MNKSETIAAAVKAYDILAARFPEIEKAHAAAVESERRHRRGDFRRYHPRAASVDVTAKLFAVKFTVDYALNADEMPTMRDYFRLRPDVLAAAATVAIHGGRDILVSLRENGMDPEVLAKLDYVTLVGEAQ